MLAFDNPQDQRLFAATEAGPYQFDTYTKTWFSILGTEAPMTTYWAVEGVPELGVVRFGTYGRGIWDYTPEPTINTGVIAGSGPAYENPPRVHVFPPEDGASPAYAFTPYGAGHYGANVAAGDVDGDGFDELLTGAGPGDIFGPHVRGFTVAGAPIPGLSFLAYGTNKYGVNVVAGDIDADGYDELITGAGPGAVFGPHVRAFDYDGTPGVEPVAGVSYFAYGTLKWGVNVAAGDIDGDGYDEIVTGAGPGAVFGPHVRGWNVDGGPAAPMAGVSYFAYGTLKYGVNVACGDVDGDGIDEIITTPGPSPVFAAHVRGWNVDGGSVEALPGFSLFAWPTTESVYGARVASGTDLDGDDRHEVVVGTGPDPDAGCAVRVFHYTGSALELAFELQAFPDGWTHGTTVATGRF
jgi:fibronectin-binding autotransporter adhesin